MNDLLSQFVIQTLLWIVLIFFLFRLIISNGKLKKEIDLLTKKLEAKNKEG